jgi:hypothetical protein
MDDKELDDWFAGMLRAAQRATEISAAIARVLAGAADDRDMRLAESARREIEFDARSRRDH